jgi:hypothetical protein
MKGMFWIIRVSLPVHPPGIPDNREYTAAVWAIGAFDSYLHSTKTENPRDEFPEKLNKFWRYCLFLSLH